MDALVDEDLAKKDTVEDILENKVVLIKPKDFNGKFVVEESYYETNGKRHASPHIFLI